MPPAFMVRDDDARRRRDGDEDGGMTKRSSIAGWIRCAHGRFRDVRAVRGTREGDDARSRRGVRGREDERQGRLEGNGRVR